MSILSASWMELADRVFNVITNEENISSDIRSRIPELADRDVRGYWRRVFRMAALCHDIGHLPFSHAAEEELLPAGWDHERLTKEILLSAEMRTIWDNLTPPVRPEHVVKLALGPRKASEFDFTRWETILSEIIIGNSFGVDRMDYLLRDSHHIGVSYGRFDHYRLIDTLRLLITPGSEEPALGVEEGGLLSAEALLWARYLMYSQVYFHPVRRIYDKHLLDFLSSWLPDGKFAVEVEKHLALTDNEVIAALFETARDSSKAGHDSACRMSGRDHFKDFYQRNPEDIKKNPEAGRLVFEAAKTYFGAENIRHDKYSQRSDSFDFPVLTRDNHVYSSLLVSTTLEKIPVVAIEYVYIIPSKREEAQRWLKENLATIIELEEEA